jgi:hypothetical protein
MLAEYTPHQMTFSRVPLGASLHIRHADVQIYW